MRTPRPSEVNALYDVVRSLDSMIHDDVGDVFFSNSDYEAISLNANNINEIRNVETSNKTAFIDGGNQEILGAPNFSVQINRVYCCMFKGKERIHPKIANKVEFFSMTNSIIRDGKIYYDTKLFPIGHDAHDVMPDNIDLSFDSTDRTVTVGTQQADISRVASIARRFAEWKLATHIVENEMEEGDVLVADGTLEAAFTNESNYLKELFLVGKEKNVVITGLSKTSRLLTTNGLSLLGAVQQIAESVTYDRWYMPLAKSKSLTHEVIIFAIKLNKSSERVFRFEIQKDQFMQLDDIGVQKIMNQLAQNSTDISFAGYPYGLIDADTFARVRKEEMWHYRTIIMSEISKTGNWKKFARHIKSIDAHDYLDMVVG